MARYAVSGTLSPDATTADTGEPAGTFSGQPYWTWTNDAGTWYLWTVFGVYLISADPPAFIQPGLFWQNSVGEYVVPGTYSPVGANTGTATVAEYVAPTPDEYITVRWRASGEFTVLKMR